MPGSSVVTAVLVAPLLLMVLPVCSYLLLLTVAAPFGVRPARPARPSPRRFAVLIPAHNEEGTIARILTSLAAVEYPRDHYDVCVVADNCTDATAGVARGAGARVYERHDAAQPGKGAALSWLLSELRREGQSYDAYVVVDADSTVSPNFLQAMNAHLAAGARVVQAYYTVLPVSGRRSEALREAALTLVHYLRPSAKRALHLSAGLKGNGMAFDRSVIDRFGWPTAGLAEDVEFHLMLVRAGVRVTFAPEAVVRGEMPGTLASSRSQQERWEAGRLATIRTQAVPLIARGLVQHNPVMVDAGVEQLVPPLSVPVGLAIVTFVVGRVAGIRMVWVIAAGAIGFFLVHVVAALLLARAPRRAYGALAQAPFYIVWKVFLYGRSLAGRHERRWVRTGRLSEQQEAGH